MPSFNYKDLAREIISDHASNPRNKVSVEPNYTSKTYQTAEGCSDKFHVFINSKGSEVHSVKYMGSGCSISTAALSIFSELSINKSKNEIKAIIQNYIKMISGKQFDEDLLEALIVFQGIKDHPARGKCAALCANALSDLIIQGES